MKRFLRLREISHVTGLARSTIYAMAADGRFPKPIKIAGNRNGWASDQIEAWQAERERAVIGRPRERKSRHADEAA